MNYRRESFIQNEQLNIWLGLHFFPTMAFVAIGADEYNASAFGILLSIINVAM